MCKFKWTDQELSRMRRQLITEYFSQNRESPKKVTCDECPHSTKTACPFAYDGYNTDGDCLADK